MSNSQPLPTAGILRRLAAIVYDSMLVFSILFAATLPSLLLDKTADSGIDNGQVVHELHPLVSGLLFQLYLLVIVVAFFCWFWRKNGQTLGMQAWRLQLEDMNGNRISFTQCLQRLAGATISCLCLGAGYWWILIDKNSLSWHDHWSKSRIVVLAKKA
jgi:uncharacterized RDD family membrane protein YckC